MTNCIKLCCTVAVLLLLWNVSAVLAASVRISSPGGSTYIIQGDAMDGVAGIDLNLSYDTTSLSTPAVSQGALISGALMSANSANIGTIKIAVISKKAFSGSGPIAVVTFASKTGAGGLSLVSVHMIDSKGATINPEPGSSGTGLSAMAGVPLPTATSTAGTTASVTPSYLGTVTIPADIQPQTGTKTAEAIGTTTQPPANTFKPAGVVPEVRPTDHPPFPKTDELRKHSEIAVTNYTSVLERFRTYQGERSPAILVALFNQKVAASISQEPAVVLSDGNSVRISIALSSPGEQSPNFALNGARLVSLAKGDQAGNWIMEVLPLANTLKASLTILNGNEMTVYPLTVAPPLKAASFSEAAFAAFLNNSDKTADLNNDGLRDYVDDYIYIANYLARKNGKQPHEQPASPQK